MKKYILVILAMMTMSGSVFATNCGNDKDKGKAECNNPSPIITPPVGLSPSLTMNNRLSNVNSNRQSQGQLQAQVANGGDVKNSGNSDVNVTYTNKQAASTSTAPALTSGDDTCMGSTSVGGQGVGFGFSFGSTWVDNNCIRLKNARQMYNLGQPKVALTLMCQDASVVKAAKDSGSNVCGEIAPAPMAAGTGPDMTDPYIAARLK